MTRAQQYIAEGYGWVVDIDLEKFFDRVNHDRLMAAVAKRVADKRLLKLKVNVAKISVRQLLTTDLQAGALFGGEPNKKTHKQEASFDNSFPLSSYYSAK